MPRRGLGAIFKASPVVLLCLNNSTPATIRLGNAEPSTATKNGSECVTQARDTRRGTAVTHEHVSPDAHQAAEEGRASRP